MTTNDSEDSDKGSTAIFGGAKICRTELIKLFFTSMDMWYTNVRDQVSVPFATQYNQRLHKSNTTCMYICRTVITHAYVGWSPLNTFCICFYLCAFDIKFGLDILHTEHCLLQRKCFLPIKQAKQGQEQG